MKQKIKAIFRKAYNKFFRKNTHGTIFGQRFEATNEVQTYSLSITPEWFRTQFERAYPDGAKLLKATSIKKTGDIVMFFIEGELVAKNLHVLESDDVSAPKLNEE